MADEQIAHEEVDVVHSAASRLEVVGWLRTLKFSPHFAEVLRKATDGTEAVRRADRGIDCFGCDVCITRNVAQLRIGDCLPCLPFLIQISIYRGRSYREFPVLS